MKTVCAAGTVVPGYDVSHYQSVNIHSSMKQAGKKFCFIKATEGQSLDDRFAAHWREAKAQGMLVGAYNFFHPSQDPDLTARRFEAAVGSLVPGDLPCVLDWEKTDGLSPLLDKERGLKFLSDVSQVTGRSPIIYGSPYFLEVLNLGQTASPYALWVAEYGPRCPLIPSAWNYWSFWQFSGSDQIDLNLFNGNLEQLGKFAGLP